MSILVVAGVTLESTLFTLKEINLRELMKTTDNLQCHRNIEFDNKHTTVRGIGRSAASCMTHAVSNQVYYMLDISQFKNAQNDCVRTYPDLMSNKTMVTIVAMSNINIIKSN